jgi:hydrogenase maturation protease
LRVLPASPNPVRCLILACGNTLRGDDGVGPWLADWAQERFHAEPAVRVISRQQWTPDLAEDVAQAQSVLFVDCALDAAPGAICIAPVGPAGAQTGLATHHMGAAELLALSEELYASVPRQAFLLTLGAGSTDMGETFSPSVNAVLPEACRLVEKTVRRLLASPYR